MTTQQSYTEKLQNYLIEHEIATEDEIQLVTEINGYNDETLNDILYARTGYRTLYQLIEE